MINFQTAYFKLFLTNVGKARKDSFASQEAFKMLRGDLIQHHVIMAVC